MHIIDKFRMFKFVYLCLLVCMGWQCAAKSPVTGYDYSRAADAWLNLHKEPTTFSDARIRCRQEGGELAPPTTSEVAQEMLTLLSDRRLMRTVFNGISSLMSGEKVKIIGGVPITSVPLGWAASTSDSEECLALTGAGALIDVSCTSVLPYFCRQDNASITRNMCGEVSGYKLDLSSGSCYKFHRALRTWYDAYVVCHEENAELAVINSPEEAEVLEELFKENLSPEQAIIGVRTKAGEWVTIDEESLSEAGFDLWAPGEPNNKDGEMCGFMRRTGMLNDDPCTTLAPSICEIML